MLEATLDVRKASMRRPVGTSNVRIIESMEVATNHRESGEKSYMGETFDQDLL
jgi:hypothetical protein